MEPTDGDSGNNVHDEDEVVRAAYARAKAEFTAADVERYLKEEKGIPLEEVIKELEEMQRQREAQKG